MALIGGAAPWFDLVLVVVSFLAGVGIASIGPGGVFVTLVLYFLTTNTPGTIAGTTSSVFFGGGILGTLAYWRSGELLTEDGSRVAVVLSGSSVVGAFVGSQLNTLLSEGAFGVLLTGFVIVVGAVIWVRERRGFSPVVNLDVRTPTGAVLLAGIGSGVGVVSGLLGVGGPILAVPVLLLVGVPLLTAVGAAQIQSVFVAGSASVGYLLRGTISPSYFVLIAPPLYAGIVVGWHVAHRIRGSVLRRVLAVVLVSVGVLSLL